MTQITHEELIAAVDVSQLMADLAEKGGCIVSANICREMEVQTAAKGGRLAIDCFGNVFIRRTKEPVFSQHLTHGGGSGPFPIQEG